MQTHQIENTSKIASVSLLENLSTIFKQIRVDITTILKIGSNPWLCHKGNRVCRTWINDQYLKYAVHSINLTRCFIPTSYRDESYWTNRN